MKKTLPDLITEYQQLRKKYGNSASMVKILRRMKGGEGFYLRFRKVIPRIPFKQIKVLAGYKDRENSLQEKLEEYRKIRKKYGDQAASVTWMVKNGYYWDYCIHHHCTGWSDFKKKAGFTEALQHVNISEIELIEHYKIARNKHGKKMGSSIWACKNGYSWIYKRARIFGMGWNGLKKRAGFKEVLCKPAVPINKLLETYKRIRKKYGSKAGSSAWLKKYYPSFVTRVCRDFGWNSFKKRAGFEEILKIKRAPSTKSLIKEYQDIRNKTGALAANSSWLRKNGYRGLMNRVAKKPMTWHSFKILAGYKDSRKGEARPLKELIRNYRILRTKNGKSLPSQWFFKNGFPWIPRQVKRHGLSWSKFRIMAGDKRGTRHEILSVADLIKEYSKIVARLGEKALTMQGLKSSGNNFIISQTRNAGLSWVDLLRRAGQLIQSTKLCLRKIGFSYITIDKLLKRIEECA